MNERENHIRERAYELWEQAGRPEGRSLEFWFAARKAMEESLPSEEGESSVAVVSTLETMETIAPTGSPVETPDERIAD